MLTLLLASGENPATAELLPLITTIVVFAVAFFVLKVRVWPRITQGLDERDRKILDEIKSAEDAREQANAALKEYEESLSTARQEAGEMIAKARNEARAAADDLRQRNEVQLADMKQRAGREIESAKQAAITELHAHAGALAAAMAGKILQREITADDQQQLVDETLRELGAVGQEQAV